MPKLKNDLRDELDRLIGQTNALLAPDAKVTMDELRGLKQDALETLLVLGPVSEPLRQEIKNLNFDPNLPTLDQLERHFCDTLNEFKRLLAIGKRIVPAQQATSSADTHAIPRSPYSDQDDALFRLIGRKQLETLTDAEIAKRYQKISRYKENAFRARLYRIRCHHGVPLSRKLKKMIKKGRRK